MARLLVERETIYQDEVDMLMEGKDVQEIIKIMEENKILVTLVTELLNKEIE